MPNKNRKRGDRFEYEIRDQLIEAGIDVERARGSDGRAIGEHESVDLRVMGEWRVQAKRVKLVAKKYRPTDAQDVVIFREDRDESFCNVRWSMLIDLWKEIILLTAENKELKQLNSGGHLTKSGPLP